MRGVSEKGYRSSAFCQFLRKSEALNRPAQWTCRFWISDIQTGLNYRYVHTRLEQAELDLGWVAQQSDLIVEKLRGLLAELSIEAPDIFVSPATQQDL